MRLHAHFGSGFSLGFDFGVATCRLPLLLRSLLIDKVVHAKQIRKLSSKFAFYNFVAQRGRRARKRPSANFSNLNVIVAFDGHSV